jgi:hypothetical protein
VVELAAGGHNFFNLALRTRNRYGCRALGGRLNEISVANYGALFNQLLGPHQDRCRDRQTKRLCGLEVDE